MDRIRIVPYRPEWPGEAKALAQRIERVLVDRVAQIRHIGSTAVPGLAAKDVLDLQVELVHPETWGPAPSASGENTSADEATADSGLNAAGIPRDLASALDEAAALLEERLPLERVPDIEGDHIPFGAQTREPEHWCKALLVASPGRRKAHVHLRIEGAANAQFAVLVRDYLRAHPQQARAYGQFKERLAEGVADPADYPEIKDPVADLLWLAARRWQEEQDA